MEECLATLMHLSKSTKSPSYPYVIKMLSKVYVELQDWDSLRELLPTLKKRKVVSATEFSELALLCYQGGLTRSVSGDSDAEKQQNLKQAWNQIPKKFHKEPALVKRRSIKSTASRVNASVRYSGSSTG